MGDAEHKENLAIDLGKLVATIFIIMIHFSPFSEKTPIVIKGGVLAAWSSFFPNNIRGLFKRERLE